MLLNGGWLMTRKTPLHIKNPISSSRQGGEQGRGQGLKHCIGGTEKKWFSKEYSRLLYPGTFIQHTVR